VSDNKFSPAMQQAFVEETLRKWQVMAMKRLNEVIAARGKSIPSDVRDGIYSEIMAEAADAMKSWGISFVDAGRHVEMKRIAWRKRPIGFDNNFMLDWVKKTGVSKFRRVPGYKNGAPKLTEDQRAERIASGVIVAYSQGRTKRKRQPWYNKTMYRQIELLYEMLAKDQADWLAKATAEQLTQTTGTINL
jgi:hypothetical protein